MGQWVLMRVCAECTETRMRTFRIKVYVAIGGVEGGGSSTPGKPNFGGCPLRIVPVCKPFLLPLPRVPRFVHEWRRLVCLFPFISCSYDI